MANKKIDSVEKLAIFTAREFDSLQDEMRQGFRRMKTAQRGIHSFAPTPNAAARGLVPRRECPPW